MVQTIGAIYEQEFLAQGIHLGYNCLGDITSDVCWILLLYLGEDLLVYPGARYECVREVTMDAFTLNFSENLHKIFSAIWGFLAGFMERVYFGLGFSHLNVWEDWILVVIGWVGFITFLIFWNELIKFWFGDKKPILSTIVFLVPVVVLVALVVM
jgi:hypothetical protein